MSTVENPPAPEELPPAPPPHSFQFPFPLPTQSETTTVSLPASSIDPSSPTNTFRQSCKDTFLSPSRQSSFTASRHSSLSFCTSRQTTTTSFITKFVQSTHGMRYSIFKNPGRGVFDVSTLVGTSVDPLRQTSAGALHTSLEYMVRAMHSDTAGDADIEDEEGDMEEEEEDKKSEEVSMSCLSDSFDWTTTNTTFAPADLASLCSVTMPRRKSLEPRKPLTSSLEMSTLTTTTTTATTATITTTPSSSSLNHRRCSTSQPFSSEELGSTSRSSNSNPSIRQLWSSLLHDGYRKGRGLWLDSVSHHPYLWLLLLTPSFLAAFVCLLVMTAAVSTLAIFSVGTWVFLRTFMPTHLHHSSSPSPLSHSLYSASSPTSRSTQKKL